MRRDAIILGCVKAKRAGVWPARDLYKSPLWERRRDYAVVSGLPWAILSAKYGLIHPNTELESYDMTMGEMRSMDQESVDEWRATLVKQLERAFSGSIAGKTIEVHAGMDYIDELDRACGELGCTIVYPLRGLGIGEQLSWYSTGGRGPRKIIAAPKQKVLF